MTSSIFSKQIQNRNFLSPIGFEFKLSKAPKVDFFSNSANIPQITLGTAIQPSYLKDVDVPGDKVVYDDFTLNFIVDEDLQNYSTIHNWIIGLGFPKTTQQFKNLTTSTDLLRDPQEQFSDGSLIVLNSNLRANFQIKYKDLFPVSLSSLQFNATLGQEEYFTAQATFKYSIYEILDMSGNVL